VLKHTGCHPRNFKIELTETGIMLNPEDTIRKMNEIKAEFPELKIMVDDFGTGYSSLNYLASLPADTLKIDLSFVSRLDNNNNEKVVSSIIRLADSLNMDYIVEGIETPEHALYFRDRTCPFMQGYFFSRPVDVSSIDQLLSLGTLPGKG
jgi:EAL domain-containing protein (putative c-di-GMP-specific phosphodiesterase class I)